MSGSAFHVKQRADRRSDHRIERRPDGSFDWVVVDWTGETIASGVRSVFADAVDECARWSR